MKNLDFDLAAIFERFDLIDDDACAVLDSPLLQH